MTVNGECIVWHGATATGGYGRVRRYGRVWSIHRLAWFHLSRAGDMARAALALAEGVGK